MKDSPSGGGLVRLRDATASLAVLFLAAALCGAQTVKDVVVFTGESNLGIPGPTLVEGRDAVLYGTFRDPNGTAGSIFSLTPSGSLTSLYTFDYTTGYSPTGLMLATDGNFYGAAGGVDRKPRYPVSNQPNRCLYGALQLHRKFGRIISKQCPHRGL